MRGIVLLLCLVNAGHVYAGEKPLLCHDGFPKKPLAELFSDSSSPVRVVKTRNPSALGAVDEALAALRRIRATAKTPEELSSGIKALYKSAGSEKQKISDALMADLRSQSDMLKAKLAAHPNDLALRTYDFVYVGAGVHSSIVKAAFNQGLKNTKNLPRVLTIEATDQVSVFGRTGKAFRGNTLEHADIGKNLELSEQELAAATRNYIPGAPIQVFDVATTQVPRAVEFQAPAIASHWAQKGDFLFESPVSSYRKIRSGPRAGLYRIRMKTGETVYSRNIVLSTGVGRPKLPTTDARSVSFILKQAKSKDPKVVFVEDLLSDVQKQADQGVNFTKKYGGKDVVVIGGGHGGAIGIEPFEGLAPASLYDRIGGTAAVSKPNSYLWVNLQAKTGEEFKKVIGGGTRYYDLAPLIDSGRIRTNQYYVYEVLKGERKAVKVSFIDKATGAPVKDAAGKVVYQEADYVIYAVGYEPINPKLAQGFRAERFEPITAPIHPNDKRLYTETDVTVGTRLYSGAGEPENVFTAGPSSGQIAHEMDPGGKAGVTINVFGSRSQALGKWLVGK